MLEGTTAKLAAMLSWLQYEMAPFDSGTPIPRGAPRSEWNAPATRRLGLKLPRLVLDQAESTFVLLFAWFGRSFDTEIEIIANIARAIGEPAALVTKFRARLEVTEAIYSGPTN
jgi:hypothetical protein